GVYISFPQTSHALVGAPPPPQRSPGRNAPPLPDPRLGVAQAIAHAKPQAPGASVTEVNFPTKGKEPAWRIGLKPPGAERPQTVQVVDATAQVKAGRGDGGGPAADPISKFMRQVHDGNDMGVVWQAVIFLAGLAPAILSLT